jgi:hypothetical protein
LTFLALSSAKYSSTQLERIAFAFLLLNDPRLVCNGLRDDRIGNELIGDHCFFLVDAAVGAEYAATAEVQVP